MYSTFGGQSNFLKAYSSTVKWNPAGSFIETNPTGAKVLTLKDLRDSTILDTINKVK
jgi:hypothetical protein